MASNSRVTSLSMACASAIQRSNITTWSRSSNSSSASVRLDLSEFLAMCRAVSHSPQETWIDLDTALSVEVTTFGRDRAAKDGRILSTAGSDFPIALICEGAADGFETT